VNDHRRRVLGFAGPTIDCRHAEADALSALETVAEDAVGRHRRRIVEAGEVAPDDEFARRMSRLRRRRRWWCGITAATAATLSLTFLRGRLLLSGDAGREAYSNE
jgi:hypothetical protein